MNEPFNLDAEVSVVGGCLIAGEIAPDAIDSCVEIVSPESFYSRSLGTIYEAILAVHEKNEPVDGTIVIAQLDAMGKLADVGGEEKVRELTALVPAASNVAHYARIVRAMWLRREIGRAGRELISLEQNGAESVDELVTQADKTVLAVTQLAERKKSNKVFTGRQVVAEFREWLEASEETDGVRAPFSFLPPLVGGRLYVLGGREKEGKTLLGTQFLRAAADGGARVGFASIEMSRLDMTQRLAATFRVPYYLIRNRFASVKADDKQFVDTYRGRLDDALARIEGWDWEIIDDETVDASALRRHQRRGKYDLLIVDHLHRIRIRDRKHERAELEDQVRGITNISREFNIPVLLLAQLSRTGSYSDPYPRPNASSLKGTGAIEQEASHVWFIYRHRNEEHQRLDTAEFIIAASRYGDEGSQPLRLQSDFMRFVQP